MFGNFIGYQTLLIFFGGCWILLYSYKESCFLFWDIVKLLANTFILLDLAFMGPA